MIGAFLGIVVAAASWFEPIGRLDATGLRVDAARTEAVEAAWVDRTIGRSFLAVPPPESPCLGGLGGRTTSTIPRGLDSALRDGDPSALLGVHARSPDHWLPAVVAGLTFVGRGDAERAASVVASTVAGRRVPAVVAQALSGEVRDREEAIGTLHLLHLHGWLLLARGRYGEDLWRSQRSAVLLGTSLADAAGRIPAPGCGIGSRSLRVVDLRTNLLVALVTAPTVDGEALPLETELAPREGRGPFGAVLAERGVARGERPEGWWRALALAADLSADLEAPETAPRTAANLAQLAIEAAPLASPDTRDALLEAAEDWWQAGRRGVSRLPAGEVEVAERVLHRVLLGLGVYRGRAVGTVREGSDPGLVELARLLESVHRWRAAPGAWLEAVTDGDPELDAELASRSEDWKRAGRLDFAVALARAGEDPRRVLRPGDPRPDELDAIPPPDGPSLGSLLSRTMLGLALGGVFGAGVRRVLRPLVDLTVGTYRHEARRRLSEHRRR